MCFKYLGAYSRLQDIDLLSVKAYLIESRIDTVTTEQLLRTNEIKL